VLRIALIGMSGSGKTFWAKRLAASGRQSVTCDDRIELRLSSHLAADGYKGINGMAAWMGWPDSATYAQREADYLAAEIAALDELLTELEQGPGRELVLDTTGSVIYTGNNILMRLRRQMTVVYLAASAEEQQLLIERYLTDPKPVLWRGAFQPKNGETSHQTVARCYSTLVGCRWASCTRCRKRRRARQAARRNFSKRSVHRLRKNPGAPADCSAIPLLNQHPNADCVGQNDVGAWLSLGNEAKT
jgi:shikimate kinase